ncbi:MAG: flagellar basal body P-ring formation chaperone FlgA [Hylemonella sp.]|nr:flagellar basal body P-ring formation chaperone FlgA [Hylemonella sp.]
MKQMPSGCKTWMRSAYAALVLFACVFMQLPARAQAVASEAQLPALAQRWLDQTLATQAARMEQPVRLQATLGPLDSRLKLAPCARVEAYLPPGSRLWGPGRVGLRCLEGVTRWNVSIPVTVKATGSAWVLRRDVAPGRSLEADDLMLAEVDWAAEASPVLAGRDAWAGQVANRALSTGQTLRQNMVRAAQVFQAGAQVRVLVQGGGFQISSQALALSPGVVGQLAKVRMDSGRVLTTTVLDARTVQVEM